MKFKQRVLLFFLSLTMVLTLMPYRNSFDGDIEVEGPIEEGETYYLEACLYRDNTGSFTVELVAGNSNEETEIGGIIYHRIEGAAQYGSANAITTVDRAAEKVAAESNQGCRGTR